MADVARRQTMVRCISAIIAVVLYLTATSEAKQNLFSCARKRKRKAWLSQAVVGEDNVQLRPIHKLLQNGTNGDFLAYISVSKSTFHNILLEPFRGHYYSMHMRPMSKWSRSRLAPRPGKCRVTAAMALALALHQLVARPDNMELSIIWQGSKSTMQRALLVSARALHMTFAGLDSARICLPSEHELVDLKQAVKNKVPSILLLLQQQFQLNHIFFMCVVGSHHTAKNWRTFGVSMMVLSIVVLFQPWRNFSKQSTVDTNVVTHTTHCIYSNPMDALLGQSWQMAMSMTISCMQHLSQSCTQSMG